MFGSSPRSTASHHFRRRLFALHELRRNLLPPLLGASLAQQQQLFAPVVAMNMRRQTLPSRCFNELLSIRVFPRDPRAKGSREGPLGANPYPSTPVLVYPPSKSTFYPIGKRDRCKHGLTKITLVSTSQHAACSSTWPPVCARSFSACCRPPIKKSHAHQVQSGSVQQRLLRLALQHLPPSLAGSHPQTGCSMFNTPQAAESVPRALTAASDVED